MDPYDALPYESIAFPETHPQHLAVLGRLFGLAVAHPAGCRVLELGCASGGNLIPMAWQLPESQFLGIDLAATQIAAGQDLIARLGLTNLTLRSADILDLDEGLGRFDYIIAHGVFSWVPPAVREHLLGLGQRLLNPGGIFYVSYNVLPGWRMRGMLRDILRHGCRAAVGPQQQLAAARATLARLGSAIGGLDALSARYLREELASLADAHPSYLLFEYLAEHNQAFLFAELAADFERHGLRYLCDSDLGTEFPSILGAQVEGALSDLDDGVELAQWLDFVTNRNFRQSVLCRGDAVLDDAIDLGRFAGLAFYADLRVDKAPDLKRVKDTPFKTVKGVELRVSHPLTKAVLGGLIRAYPSCLPLAALLPEAARGVTEAGGGALAEQGDECLAELFSLFAHRGIGARLMPLHRGGDIGPQPRTTTLAAAQLAAGIGRVTTLHHGNLDLDAFAKRILLLLDGTRGVDAVTEVLLGELGSGALAPPAKLGRKLPSVPPRERVRAATEELIALLDRYGVLDRPAGTPPPRHAR